MAQQTPLPIRSHQMRAFFNTSQLSPLMKEYFGSSTKSVKKPCFLLRTTPFDGCHVGGEATFHKQYVMLVVLGCDWITSRSLGP